MLVCETVVCETVVCETVVCETVANMLRFCSIGASPSGKAADFESAIRRFESFRPSFPVRSKK